MVQFNEISDVVKAINTAIQHNYWILKNVVFRLEVKGSKNLKYAGTSHQDTHSNISKLEKDEDSGLKVVGVGFGRTGTYSLALALNSLGYPTLHTYKLYENSDIIDMWTEKVFLPSIESNEFKLGNPDFDLITSHGFVGALDFPIALYFEQLNEIYPDCKFILTERENSEIWYESWRSMVISVSQTTNLGAGILKHVNQLSLYFRWLLSYVNKDQSILSIPPGQPLPNPNKANSIMSYEEHSKRVREVIPSDRLLIYDVREGWEPLCRFLDVKECPTLPFPKTNSSLFCKIQASSAVIIPFSIITFVLVIAFVKGFKKLTGKPIRSSVDRRWNGCRRVMKHTSTLAVCTRSILRQKMK